ncbi:hypothetical protein LSAT2_009321 [Lamellibrachia satsuma]|nr:hypothetical protein LSAT2_009321 [Lamellibrachia satsuma]
MPPLKCVVYVGQTTPATSSHVSCVVISVNLLVFRRPFVNAQEDCEGKSNGIHGWGCRSYTICEDGHGERIDCTPPQVYDAKSQGCKHYKKVGPPCGLVRSCSGKGTGLFADKKTGCSTFFTCIDGTYIGQNQCNTGLIFSNARGLCDWPWNASC